MPQRSPQRLVGFVNWVQKEFQAVYIASLLITHFRDIADT